MRSPCSILHDTGKYLASGKSLEEKLTLSPDAQLTALYPGRIVEVETPNQYWAPSLFHIASRRLIFYSSGHTSDKTLVRLSIHDDKSYKELAALDIPRDNEYE